jgi:hypothetical protein
VPERAPWAQWADPADERNLIYVFAKLGQGTESVFNAYSTATTADGIPIDSYGKMAAQTVLEMFALLGLNVLVLPLLGVLALIRYRAMIPLMYLTMMILYFCTRALLFVHPIARTGGVQPIGFYVNLALLAVLLIGFALSLTKSALPARQ